MLKKNLAIIAIGSLIASSSFATPLHINKMFMKDHMMKSSLSSKKHSQQSQFKFSGTWTGICSYDGYTLEEKIKIEEDNTQLTITDLINESDETHAYDVIETISNSDKDWYDSFTSRLTKANENTLRFEGVGVFGKQLPSSDNDKGLVSGVLTSIYSINNNQLTIDTNMKLSGTNLDEISSKCILKRVG